MKAVAVSLYHVTESESSSNQIIKSYHNNAAVQRLWIMGWLWAIGRLKQMSAIELGSTSFFMGIWIVHSKQDRYWQDSKRHDLITNRLQVEQRKAAFTYTCICSATPHTPPHCFSHGTRLTSNQDFGCGKGSSWMFHYRLRFWICALLDQRKLLFQLFVRLCQFLLAFQLLFDLSNWSIHQSVKQWRSLTDALVNVVESRQQLRGRRSFKRWFALQKLELLCNLFVLHIWNMTRLAGMVGPAIKIFHGKLREWWTQRTVYHIGMVYHHESVITQSQSVRL